MVKRIPYDKDAVIQDLAKRDLRPAQIAEKYGIAVGNVYTIRSAARRAGIINSRGEKSIGERVRNENSVFTPALRERIKRMREEELTSTEISQKLTAEGIDAPYSKVCLVMARAASDIIASNSKLARRWGKSRG